jgi:uncharacterized cupredoxin-like copper-binding protein
MKFLLLFVFIVSSPAFAQGEAPFGRPADPKKAQRSVRVEMNDQMRYSPAEILVKRGETIRFEVVNKGKVEHELVLGTLAGLKQHLEHMKQHAGAAHQESHQRNEVEVAPGKSGVLGWQFTKAGEFYYGCLIPGHFEAGMIGKVIVK